MTEQSLDRIVFLGMDLSGKTQTAAYAGGVLTRAVYSRLLGNDQTFYQSAVTRMNSEVMSGEEKDQLFEEIYLNDLENFRLMPEEQNGPAIQDNLGIVRVIAYSYCFGRNVDRLIEILKSYPRPEFAFYLTCSKAERSRRLELRSDQKKENIYERLLREDPKLFYALDDYGLDLYRDTFGCEVIDTTCSSEAETLDHVIKMVKKDD